jgi:hypothetical protein
MSSLELGFSAVRNPRSSAVSRIHAHNFRVNAGGKSENPFLVFASTFAGTGAVYLLITSHERRTVLLCAVGVVLLHGIVSFSLPSLWHRAAMPPTALWYISLSWLATVWIVYERVKCVLNSPVAR